MESHLASTSAGGRRSARPDPKRELATGCAVAEARRAAGRRRSGPAAEEPSPGCLAGSARVSAASVTAGGDVPELPARGHADPRRGRGCWAALLLAAAVVVVAAGAAAGFLAAFLLLRGRCGCCCCCPSLEEEEE